ncbi:MAG: hypothetical protein EKK47_06075 [Burkholderiales bacterium]|nr:MAG: hypothetical protein EKK47_06075 [Burkholderiales bacterium]
MKRILALLMVPVLAQAATTFDGYEAFYASFPDALFHGDGIQLQPYAMEGDDEMRYGWQGVAAGRRQVLEVRDGVLTINGRVLKRNRIQPFPGEAVSDTDLGMGTVAYFSSGWTCVENTPTSASGSAVRHRVVYLIKRGAKGYEAWKLSSLFAHCTSIRVTGKEVLVQEATYRYVDGQENPVGVNFRVFSLNQGRFVPTDMRRSITFVEPGNVYKFALDK